MKSPLIIGTAILLVGGIMAFVPESSAVKMTSLTDNTLVCLTGPYMNPFAADVLQVNYINTANVSLSTYVWVDVMNSANQSVAVYAGGATIGAGQNMTTGAVLFNLPSGNYTAVVFATTTSGVVVSKVASVSFRV